MPLQDKGCEIRAKSAGLTWDSSPGTSRAPRTRDGVMALGEVANMAVFMASDKASGMTGTTINLSMGALAG